MRKRVIDLRTERPCLDIASLGRRGPEARLTLSEVASIARTVRRVPEVMIKVSGARTLQYPSGLMSDAGNLIQIPSHRAQRAGGMPQPGELAIGERRSPAQVRAN